MSDPQNTLDNWQLKEAKGRTLNKWQLREAGPEALGYLQLLQENASAADWQPVEYTRGQTARPNWILPSVVGLVLVAVSGYLIWLGINRLGSSPALTSVANAPAGETAATVDGTDANQDQGAQATTGDDGGAAGTGQSGTDQGGQTDGAAQAPAAVPAPDDTPTPLPTPESVVEPTAAPESEPTLIERTIATAIHQYGVNLRDAPNTNSNVVELLNEGTTAVVLEQSNDGWVQVQLEGTETTGWVSSEFIELQSDFVPATPEQIAALTAAEPEPVEEPTEAAADEPTAASETTEEPAAESSEPVEATAEETAQTVSATINTPAGLNARAEPNANAEVIILLENEKTLTVVSQSDDELWVEVALDDGSTAWLFAEFVAIEGDLAALNVEPTVEEPAATEAAPDAGDAGDAGDAEVGSTTETPVAEETAEEPVEVVTTGVVPPEPFSDVIPSGASVVVENQYGVNARSTASLDGEVALVVPEGAALQIVGKTENDEWVQVVLPNNTLAWIFAQTVKTAAVNTVDAVEPPAVGAPLEIYEPPVEAEVLADAERPAEAPAAETEEAAATEEVATEEAAAPEEAASEETATDEAAQPDVQLVFTTTVPDGPAVIVDSIVGINARTEPNAEDSTTIIERVPNGVALPATGRTSNNDWVQVLLPDNTTAWIFTQAVQLENVTLEELPVVETP